MSARQVLENLQTAAAGPGAAGATYDDRIRERLREDMTRVSEENRKLLEEVFRRRAVLEANYGDKVPTRYQSLQDFVRLLRAKERVDVTLRKVGEFAPRDNVVFGSLEGPQLNAIGGFLPDSHEYLIVFNRGLLMALLAASNLVTLPLTMTPKTIDEAVDDIDADIVVRLVPRFAHLLEAVSAGRSPSPEITIPVLEFLEKEMRWTWLEDAAMEFVFAHEYAHVLRGHLDTPAGAHLNEDLGGWGAEYEADSLAIDFLVQGWADRHEGNPLVIAFALQGVCLFFTLLSQIEQYAAEVRGEHTAVWTAAKPHPPTYIRWVRMLDKLRGRVPAGLQNFMVAQMMTVARVLEAFYVGVVPVGRPTTEAGSEWQFQRRAMTVLARDRLVPPHIFIAMRCARAALAGGAALDESAMRVVAAAADDELKKAGARPLLDYGARLASTAHELSELALTNSRALGVDKAEQWADRLADIFLLDGRTRYPLAAQAG